MLIGDCHSNTILPLVQYDCNSNYFPLSQRAKNTVYRPHGPPRYPLVSSILHSGSPGFPWGVWTRLGWVGRPSTNSYILTCLSQILLHLRSNMMLSKVDMALKPRGSHPDLSIEHQENEGVSFQLYLLGKQWFRDILVAKCYVTAKTRFINSSAYGAWILLEEL
jgi:hypothetical protein